MVTKAEILSNIPCLAEADKKYTAFLNKQEEERKKEEEKRKKAKEKEYKDSLKRIIKTYKNINIKKLFKKEVNIVPKYSYKQHAENFIDVTSSNGADRGVSVIVDIEDNITFSFFLYDYTYPEGISEDRTEQFIGVPFGDYDEELLKKLFNITAEECQQIGGYDKILTTLSKVLSKKVVKEVKEQIENMLSDNITDIICTIQENS